MPIPKKIHFYWGNETMSWMRYMTLKSFRMFNPDWEIILYISPCAPKTKTWSSPNFQDYFYFKGSDYMPHAKELNINILPWDLADNGVIPLDNNFEIGASHKSNFFKWSKLATEGGVYSDLDILYFRPIDDFYNKLEGYTTAICQTKYLSIGLLASAGQDDFFKDIFISGIERYNAGEYQSAGVVTIYDLYNKIPEMDDITKMVFDNYPRLKSYDLSIRCPQDRVLQIAQEKYPQSKFYNIPMDLVYPFDSTQVGLVFDSDLHISDLSPETIGYHWYAGHLIAQNFNNLFTEQNYTRINSLFTNIVKEII